MEKKIVKARMMELDGDIKIVPVHEEAALLKEKLESLKEEQPQNTILLELFEETVTKMRQVTSLLERKVVSLEQIESLLKQYVNDNAETQEELRKYLKSWS